jgi:hypothetical protein
MMANACLDQFIAMEARMQAQTMRDKALRRTSRGLQDQIGEMSAHIDVVAIDSSCVHHKHLLTHFRNSLDVQLELQTRILYVLCAQFWVQGMLVPLPCRCLMHPVCMFKVALSTLANYPTCDAVSSNLFIGQWRFFTDKATLQAAISACMGGTEKKGWKNPLDPASVQKEGLCNDAIADWGRGAEVHDSEAATQRYAERQTHGKMNMWQHRLHY